jgi:hypothetical protein
MDPASAPTGRFAPSPTGPLHAGSLVAALGSWLDARAQGGRWLVRIEDVDTPRCLPGMDAVILRQLATLGLRPDEPPAYQSQRGDAAPSRITAAHGASSKRSRSPVVERTQVAHENRGGSGSLHSGPVAVASL